MTQSVYIVGDLADLMLCRVFDATTGTEIERVSRISVHANVGTGGVVYLSYVDNGTMKVPDTSHALVKRPDAYPRPPQNQLDPALPLYQVSVSRTRDVVQQLNLFRLKFNRYEYDSATDQWDYDLMTSLAVSANISDFDLHAHNLAGNLQRQIFERLALLGSSMGCKVMEQILPLPEFKSVLQLGTFPKLASGGIVVKLKPTFVYNRLNAFPLSVPDQAKPTTCPECKGAGEVHLFNGMSPCSNGCKKP